MRKIDKQNDIHYRATSRDSLRKNYCPSCRQYKNVAKKIKRITVQIKSEYEKISYCPDCGTTLSRENKFFDLGGG